MCKQIYSDPTSADGKRLAKVHAKATLFHQAGDADTYQTLHLSVSLYPGF